VQAYRWLYCVSGYIHQLEVRGFGDFISILAHGRHMHLNSFRHTVPGFLEGTARGHTAREIGSVGPVASARLLK
jgi:hypothetical protein